jgi:hypothetical protein
VNLRLGVVIRVSERQAVLVKILEGKERGRTTWTAFFLIQHRTGESAMVPNPHKLRWAEKDQHHREQPREDESELL